MLNDLFKILGKDATSKEVKATLKKHGLTVVKRSPPSRVYYCAPKNGVDVVANRDRVDSIQLFVLPLDTFAAYASELPFGIKKEMGRSEVEKLLGKPIRKNEMVIRFSRPEAGMVVVVSFNLEDKMDSLEFSLPS